MDCFSEETRRLLKDPFYHSVLKVLSHGNFLFLRIFLRIKRHASHTWKDQRCKENMAGPSVEILSVAGVIHCATNCENPPEMRIFLRNRQESMRN